MLFLRKTRPRSQMPCAGPRRPRQSRVGSIENGEAANFGTHVYLREAAPSIRLIYRTTPNGIEILDVVQKATLHTFLNKNGGTAVTGKSGSAKSATRPYKITPSELEERDGCTYPKKSKKTVR